MSDHKQEPASISQQPDAENKKGAELSEEALEKVTGGGANASAGGQKAEYLKVTMQNVLISSY
jgi:hypothetical protein